VNRVVPRAEVLDAAIAWADEITQKNPWSVRRLKRMINEDLHGELLRALDLETAATVEAFRRPEARAAAESFRERT
jgi:enoyl-CoA hydratase/carnithine racemase